MSHQWEKAVHLHQEGLGEALPASAVPRQALPWWPTGGELCCLLQAEGDGGSGEPGSEAVTREKHRVPAFAPDLGLFARNRRTAHRRIPEPRAVVLLGPLSEEGFYNKQSSCVLYAECLLSNLSGLFSSPVVFGMPDGACPSSCFTTFSCTCAGSGQQSNSTSSPLVPVSLND